MNPRLVPLALALLRHMPIERVRWRLARAVDTHLKAMPVKERRRVAGGAEMELDTTDFLQRILYITGDFEPVLSACILENLKPGDCFLDVGANVGFYALRAARRVGPAGSVLAFEPNARTHAALATNIALNRCDNVTALAIALSDRSGEADFFADDDGNSGASSLVRRDAKGPGIPVAVATWDDYAAGHAVRLPTLVKIDVEGFEVRVLGGMTGLLTTPGRPRFLIEISEWSLHEAGSSPEELHRIMADHGYASRTVSEVRKSNHAHHGVSVQYDALFVPRP